MSAKGRLNLLLFGNLYMTETVLDSLLLEQESYQEHMNEHIARGFTKLIEDKIKISDETRTFMDEQQTVRRGDVYIFSEEDINQLFRLIDQIKYDAQMEIFAMNEAIYLARKEKLKNENK